MPLGQIRPARQVVLEVLGAAGDTDGDGYDDVIVGAFQYNESTGRVYV